MRTLTTTGLKYGIAIASIALVAACEPTQTASVRTVAKPTPVAYAPAKTTTTVKKQAPKQAYAPKKTAVVKTAVASAPAPVAKPTGRGPVDTTQRAAVAATAVDTKAVVVKLHD